MKRTALTLLIVGLLVAATASVVMAGKPVDFDDKGNETSWDHGPFDKWGYNYQAHLFSGLYHNASRPDTPCVLGSCASDTYLIMKWSDEWLSNQDRNDDGKLDRGYSCDPVNASSSACEGAWLTNHQRGEYVNDDGRTCKWTYFVKIVYPPGGPVDIDGNGYDDNTGGSIIWGAYVRIQQVSNDTCGGEHGNVFSVQPAGFGAYK